MKIDFIDIYITKKVAPTLTTLYEMNSFERSNQSQVLFHTHKMLVRDKC